MKVASWVLGSVSHMYAPNAVPAATITSKTEIDREHELDFFQSAMTTHTLEFKHCVYGVLLLVFLFLVCVLNHHGG